MIKETVKEAGVVSFKLYCIRQGCYKIAVFKTTEQVNELRD
jgi:hypothetical protein